MSEMKNILGESHNRLDDIEETIVTLKTQQYKLFKIKHTGRGGIEHNNNKKERIREQLETI